MQLHFEHICAGTQLTEFNIGKGTITITMWHIIDETDDKEFCAIWLINAWK